MKTYFLIISIAAASFLSSSLNAQESKWTQYFSGKSVVSLAAEGKYIWAGLLRNGVVRYNKLTGEKMFFNSSNLPFTLSNVTDIVIDKHHNKWIAANGLVKYNDTSWVKYTPKNSEGFTKFLRYLAIDSSDNIWAGCYHGGLAKFDGYKWTFYTISNSGIPSNNVNCVAVDSAQNIWLGTDNGLAVFDGQNFLTYNNTNSGLKNNNVDCLKFDKTGVLWMGTQYSDSAPGLYSFKNGQWQSYEFSISGIGNEVDAIHVDNKNIKWFGSYGELVSFDGRKWTQYHDPNLSVEVVFVNSVISDENNIKWLASDWIKMNGKQFTGLLSFDGNVFTSHDLSNSNIIDHHITAVAVDPGGNVYAANYSNSIMKFDGTSWSRIPLPENRDDYNLDAPVMVNSMAIDKHQNLWAANWFDGVFKIKGDSVINKYSVKTSSLTSNYVYDIFVDSLDQVWVADDRSLVKIGNDGKWTLYNHTNSTLPDAQINAIAIDSKGCLWLATSIGLVKFDSKESVIYDFNNTGIPLHDLKTVLVDKSDNKWVGNYWGLTCYNNKVWNLYNVGNSVLPSNDITRIKEDYNNNIWVTSIFDVNSGFGGVTRISGSQWETFDYFNSGIGSEDINDIAFDKYGNKWIATNNGGLVKFSFGDTLKIHESQWGSLLPFGELKQNYPNPFNPATTIKYKILVPAHVELKVFDMLGREVATLVNKKQDEGEYTVKFDGSGLSSGIYIYRIQAGEFTDSKKLLLIR